jgi:hypothetical protein
MKNFRPLFLSQILAENFSKSEIEESENRYHVQAGRLVDVGAHLGLLAALLGGQLAVVDAVAALERPGTKVKIFLAKTISDFYSKYCYYTKN